MEAEKPQCNGQGSICNELEKPSRKERADELIKLLNCNCDIDLNKD